MKIAIISAGRSAYDFDFHSIKADQSISINVAAMKFPCDYWCFSDAESFYRWHGKIGSPVLFTRKAVHKQLNQMPRYSGTGLGRMIHSHALIYQDDIAPPVEQWNLFSGTAAIGLAWHLGATELLLYGYDLAGNYDCCGRHGLGRTIERWVYERIVFDRWLAFLKSTEVKVDWITDAVQSKCKTE